jgi:hypothetical protein
MQSTLLRVLLYKRHWQTHGVFLTRYDQTAEHAAPEMTGKGPSRTTFGRWLTGAVGKPHPGHCRVLEALFPGYTADQLFLHTEELLPPAEPGPWNGSGDVLLHPAPSPLAGSPPGPAWQAAASVPIAMTGFGGPAGPPGLVAAGLLPAAGRQGSFSPTLTYAGLIELAVTAGMMTSQHASNMRAHALPETTIEEFTTEVTAIARGFGDSQPADVLTRTLALHTDIQAAVEQTSWPTQQTELHLLLAQTSALLASVCLDLGAWPSAIRYAAAVDDYATMIDHRGARSYAHGMMSTIAFWTGQGTESVRHAQTAVELAPAGVATVRANAILSRAWASVGAVEQVRDAIRAAGAAQGVDGNDALHDRVGGEFGFSRARLARNSSTALLQVGDPGQAAVQAQNALDLLRDQHRPSWSTVEAETRIDLAACHLLTGHPDAAHQTLSDAAGTLAPVWQIPAPWRRTGVLGRVDRLINHLADPRWTGVREAVELRDLAVSFSAERPSPPAALSAV